MKIQKNAVMDFFFGFSLELSSLCIYTYNSMTSSSRGQVKKCSQSQSLRQSGHTARGPSQKRKRSKDEQNKITKRLCSKDNVARSERKESRQSSEGKSLKNESESLSPFLM
jgi:hypothetical protein